MATLPGISYLKGIMRDESKKTRLLFIIDGALINAALVLTAGIFLSGYIVYLGGSDFLVGLLNNSMTWAAMAAVFSYLIYERMVRRKKFLLTLLVASRLLVCSAVFLPLLFGKGQMTLGILTAMVIVGNVLWGIYAIGYSVWMIESFSKETRRAFIYQRIFWLRITFSFFTILMGFILDWSGKSYAGFVIIFLTSLVLSVIDAVVLHHVKEPEKVIDKEHALKFKMLFEPFTVKRYGAFLVFMFLFQSSLSISSSFTPLYLIRYLQIDYKVLSIINVIAYFFMIVCIGMWNRIENKRGLMFVFKISALIVVMEFLVYGFIKGDTTFLLYLAPVFSGIGHSGFNIAVFNYRCELMPENGRTVYEGWFGAVTGLGIMAGPVIGNFMMNRLPVLSNAFFQYSKFQLMYLISFALAIGVVLTLLKRPKSC
jgi:MFS family permease